MKIMSQSKLFKLPVNSVTLKEIGSSDDLAS